jgi:hypothetical protein
MMDSFKDAKTVCKYAKTQVKLFSFFFFSVTLCPENMCLSTQR